MRVYTHVDAVLGPKRSFTPEKYLLCEDVPLARTGTQIYHTSELPGLAPDMTGRIHVERTADEVFSEKALASFQGKPFTFQHPSSHLEPNSVRQHFQGVILNPRRGEGAHSDMMVGDILVMHHEGIKAITEDNIREVSGGYSAEYVSLGPGRAKQTDIIGNHVALVPQGRCGGRCSIGDEAHMTTTTVPNPAAATTVRVKNWKDRVRAAMTLNDQAAFDAAMADAEAEPAAAGGAVHVHVGAGSPMGGTVWSASGGGAGGAAHTTVPPSGQTNDFAALISAAVTDSLAPVLARLDVLEGKKTPPAAAAAPAAAPAAAATADAAFYTADQLPDIIQDTVARAEIIVPGIKLATLDAKGDPKQTTDSICQQRRSTLMAAMYLPTAQAVVQPLFVNQPRLETMTCDQVAVIFQAASENIKARNTASSTSGGGKSNTSERVYGNHKFSGPITNAEINIKNRLAHGETV